MLTTVLLVEDNPADARLLEHFLDRAKGKHYTLVKVATLRAAMKAARETQFDAILLDLSLPDSQGLDTLAQLYGATLGVPIVVLTGLDDEELAIAALREGAQDYLIKNEIHSNILTRAIHYAIERQQMFAQLQASELRYRGIVEDRTEFICRFLPDGTITFANEAYCRYFGQKTQEVIGQRFLPQMPARDWLEVQAHFEAIAPHEPTRTIEHRVILPNREIRWQQWIERGIFDDRGKIVEYQSVGRDITDLKQTQERLQQQLDRERLIRLITQRILQSSDLSEILQIAVDEVRAFLECDRAIVCHFRSDGSSEVVVESLQSGWPSTLDWVIPPSGIAEQLTYLRAQEECDRTEKLELRSQEFLERFEVNAQWVVPIWTSARSTSDSCDLPLVPPLASKPPSLEGPPRAPRVCLWGLLVAHQCRETRQWQESEIVLLEQVANQVAIAIQQFQLYQDLKAANQELILLASVDGLTQVANRRCFDEYLEQQWQQSVREQWPLSLILCDIDFFKFYNDCYGHLAGDECLKQVVAEIGQIVRHSSDLVARYGGEEFVVVLPDTDEQKAFQIAQRIATRVKALKIPHARSQVSEYVTLSLGVASTIPSHDANNQQLIAVADAALYEAKTSGRDRAVQKWMVATD
jgi:diguanylate cyclase (GGDEF)-like protein/PAS domain S-box-containing protein